jgi:hypothetical protein
LHIRLHETCARNVPTTSQMTATFDCLFGKSPLSSAVIHGTQEGTAQHPISLIHGMRRV